MIWPRVQAVCSTRFEDRRIFQVTHVQLAVRQWILNVAFLLCGAVNPAKLLLPYTGAPPLSCLTLPPSDVGISLSSLGGEGWGEEAALSERLCQRVCAPLPSPPLAGR